LLRLLLLVVGVLAHALAVPEPARSEPVVYWADSRPSTIQRARVGAPNPEDLVARSTSLLGIAIDGSDGRMYWADFIGLIQRAELDGSGPEAIVVDPGISIVFDPSTGSQVSAGGPIALDVAAGKVYWSSFTPDGTLNQRIRRANLDGSNIEDVRTGLPDVGGIALDPIGVKMYWTTGDQIRRVNLDGSAEEALLSGLPGPGAIAFEPASGSLYWGDGNGIHRFHAVSGVEDLVPSNAWVTGIALAGGKLYWTEFVFGGGDTTVAPTSTDRVSRTSFRDSG
jgi:hypothetical protein